MTRAIVSPVFFAVVASLSCVAATFADANWPQFRGPGGQGHAHVSSAPTVWSEDENIRWKTPLPGRGWSSPVVWGDQIWMTTAIEERATEEEAAAHKTDAPTDHLDMNVLRSVSLRALCVQRSDGQLLHDTELFQRDWPEPVHALNSYASPTPVIEAGRVYCNFGTWGTGCIDTTTGDIV